MSEETRRLIEEKLKENNKGNWFIRHIQKHLDDDDKGLKLYKLPPKVVGCVICGKTVDEIASETLEEIKKEFKT